MANIAIASTNKELIRFLKIELELFGHKVSVYSKSVAVKSNFDILFVDVESINDSQNLNCRCPVVRISENPNGDGGEQLSWPFSIKDIHRVCESVLNSNGTENEEKAESKQKNEADTVYLVEKTPITVLFSERRIKLSKNEFIILRELCGARGETVPRTRIMELLGAESGNISDVYVCHLREKLEAPVERRLIFTERGKGYRTTLILVEQ